ncbi:helix-turn-helix domain-containing protein [Proteus mirabilis]|uniref:Helix-turn-helix domain-containing protein n=1 Tax=Proteus mirabilis TaxID=584 RepID=A0ABD5LVE5_PROMI
MCHKGVSSESLLSSIKDGRKKIAYYRRVNGLTLSELAKKIGISQQQQSRYERGINRVSLDRLYQYACFFGISLSDLFN